MRITFRQGIVRCPPNFLELSGGSVSIVVPSAESVIVTFADGASNYLLTERLDVNDAWPGPFATGSQSYWLYWDIDRLTGTKTYGHTLYEPVEGAVAPSFPQNDQHWYDTTSNKMFVWNTTANRWQQKIRVFAAQLLGGNTFTSMSINSPAFTGTQTGISTPTQILAGALVYDADGKVLKRNNGTFFTTEDVAVTGVASSSQVKLGGLVLEAAAQTNIPAFSVVQFSDFNKIILGNSSVASEAPYGLTDQDAATGDIVSVMMEGVVSNPAWDWTAAGVNAPLYLTTTGGLTATPPVTPIIIAHVLTSDTILIKSSTTIINGGGGGGGGLPPIGSPNQVLGVSGDGAGLEYKSITGTANQIVVTNTANQVNLSFGEIDCGTF